MHSAPFACVTHSQNQCSKPRNCLPVLPYDSQGVVSTAEELHALEEAEFAAWQAALASTAQQLTAAAAAGTETTTQHAAAPHSSAADASAAHPNQQQHQQQGRQQQQVQQEGLVQARLQQGSAPGPGPISNYEGRLDFWRQLWRTLEMSDVICMIMDARWALCDVVAVKCSHSIATAQVLVRDAQAGNRHSGGLLFVPDSSR
jgi:hypothetical protein